MASVQFHPRAQELLDDPGDGFQMVRAGRAGEGRWRFGEREERHQLIDQVIVHRGTAVEVGEEGIHGLVRDGFRPGAAAPEGGEAAAAAGPRKRQRN